MEAQLIKTAADALQRVPKNTNIPVNVKNVPGDLVQSGTVTESLPKQMYFDDIYKAKDYIVDYVQTHPYKGKPSTRGMPEIHVKSTDPEVQGFIKRTPKSVGKTKVQDWSLPEHVKLNVSENLQQSADLRRTREAIDVDKVREIFDRFGRPDQADEYIQYVTEGNRRVRNEVDAINAEAGYLKVSYGHKKALANKGFNIPRNVEVEDYTINVSKGAKDDPADELLRALNVPFSWEEDIIKWIDPQVNSFWDDLTKKEQAKLIKAVASYKGDESIADVIDDTLAELGWSTRKTKVDSLVGRSNTNFKKPTQFPEQIQRHITRSQEIGITEPQWKNGSIDYTWRPDSNTGQIDIPPQDKKGFKGLRNEFFSQIEDLPNGSIWELNPKFKDEKRRRIYSKLFEGDPRITRNPDPTLGWVLTVP